MRVAVGGIIHPRWTVAPYLEAMHKLQAGPHTIVPCWVADGEVAGANAYLVDDRPRYNRETADTETLRQTYERLGTMRNMLAQIALGLDCEALLSVDSDIIVPETLLVNLAEANHPWVGALVPNSPTNRRVWNVFHYLERDGLCQHFEPVGVGADGVEWPRYGVWHCDPRDTMMVRDLAVGAVALYSREILLRARWHSNGRGHQEDLGFAADAFAAGYRAAYVPVVCEHLTVARATHA